MPRYSYAHLWSVTFAVFFTTRTFLSVFWKHEKDCRDCWNEPKLRSFPSSNKYPSSGLCSANPVSRANVLVTGTSAAERIPSHAQRALLVTRLFLSRPGSPNLMA